MAEVNQGPRGGSGPVVDAHANQRRTEILAATFRVIAERGVDHTRLADVADVAEVSIGMIQHYFRTRSRLLSATFWWKLDESFGHYENAIREDGSAWEDIENLCWLLTREPFNEIYSFWLEFFSLCNRDSDLAALGTNLWDRWTLLVRSVLDRGVKQGEFVPLASVPDIADRFVSLADGLGFRVLTHHSSMSIERMNQLLLEFMALELGIESRSNWGLTHEQRALPQRKPSSSTVRPGH